MKLSATSLKTLLILHSLLAFGIAAPPKNYFLSEKGEELTCKVLRALKRLVGFFERDYESINLDGIYGLRLAEGQLEYTLEFLQQSEPVSDDDFLRQEVESLVIQASRAADLSLPYIEAKDPEYYNTFKNSIDKGKKVLFIPRRVDSFAYLLGYVDESFRRDPAVHEYNETVGDDCFSQMLRSPTDRDECEVTEECLRMMTKSGTRNYVATHQLLFTMEIPPHKACKRKLESVLPSRSIHSFQQQLCTVIFMEAIQNSKYSRVTDKNQDLFLEQGLLCGMMGFVDFLREDWLRMILSWQIREGCFTNEQAQEMRSRKEKSKLLRKLLEENYIEDGGCLSHKSGLAAGLLALYLRELVENEGSLMFN